MRQVVFKRGAALLSEAIFTSGEPAFELLFAGDIARIFELARVDAEIAVCGTEDLLQILEGEALVYREGADDAKAKALMNDPVQRARTSPGRYDLR